MLRTFGPGRDGAPIEVSKGTRIPKTLSWIDLESPTPEEASAVETALGIDIPTHDDLKEIEPSSRLYEKNGALYMTMSALTGFDMDEPTTTPIAFVLSGRTLLTLRYATPRPVKAFMDHTRREPDLAKDPLTAIIRLLDAMIDRLADELESVGEEIERISSHIFAKKLEARRIPADRLTALLTRIGLAQRLIAKIRYSAVSTARLLAFFEASKPIQSDKDGSNRAHVHSLINDIHALSEHASFQADNMQFLLDASLGLISIEQNAAMKLFSWAAVVFLPPSVVVGYFGMNFHYFPQLNWPGGGYAALGVMLASAVLPYAVFKWRRWI